MKVIKIWKRAFLFPLPLGFLLLGSPAFSLDISQEHFNVTFPMSWKVKEKNPYYTLVVNVSITPGHKQNATVVVERNGEQVKSFQADPAAYYKGLQLALAGSSNVKKAEKKTFGGISGTYLVSEAGPVYFVQFSFVTSGILYSLQFTSGDARYLDETEALALSVFRTLKPTSR